MVRHAKDLLTGIERPIELAPEKVRALLAGRRHPAVVAFDERAKPGINGPVIEEGEA